MTDPVPFSDVALAAYCPRKLDHATDRSPPARAKGVADLAFEYPTLADADSARTGAPALRVARPLSVSPDTYRARLACLRRRDAWPLLSEPAETNVLVTGKDCRGYVSKIGPDADALTLVSPGDPPENGVWGPQGVKAVAAAKALSWREGESVERVLVEYPAHAVVRSVSLTTRRKAAYRSALRTARADAPRPRCGDAAKYDACEFERDCGARSRSLRSLLFG